MKFNIPESVYPFEHHWLDTETYGRLHYLDEGQGQPLLLCHGNPTWSFLYRKMIPGLSERFRCIAVDLPGFGLSEPPAGYDFTPRSHSFALEAVVDHLDLRDVIVVGQDWGGPTGLGVAGRQPDRVAGLVLGNTFAWPLTNDRRAVLFSRLMGGPPGRASAWAFNGVVRFFVREGIRHGIPKHELRWYLEPFADRRDRYPTWFFPGQLAKAVDYLAEVEALLADLRDRPALLLWATRDFAFGEPYRNRFRQLFPDNELRVLDGAGHFWQEDESRTAVDAISKWASS